MLIKIRDYLGDGRTNSEKWVIENLASIEKFMKIVDGKIIVKKMQMDLTHELLELRKTKGVNFSDEEMIKANEIFELTKQEKHTNQITDFYAYDQNKKHASELQWYLLEDKAKNILKSLDESCTIFKTGEEHHFFGKTLEEQHRMNISLAKQMRPSNEGLTEQHYVEIRKLRS